jgi:hypothetical protein
VWNHLNTLTGVDVCIYVCNIDLSVLFCIVHVKKPFQVNEAFWNIPFGPEVNLNNIYKFSSYRKENSLRPYRKNQPVKSVWVRQMINVYNEN